MKKILYGIKAKCHEIGFTDRTDMQNDDNCSYTIKKNKNDNLQAEKKDRIQHSIVYITLSVMIIHSAISVFCMIELNERFFLQRL